MMYQSTSRVVIVTGANKGIGYATVKRLVKQAPRLTVVLTSRNETLGKEAAANLLKLEPNLKESLHFHALDIDSKESRDNFKDWIQQTFGKFDILVNNAGALLFGELYNSSFVPTLSDVEKILSTNYFNTRALTETLLPLLAADGKIISVSSSLGQWSKQGEPLLKLFTKPDFADKDLEDIYALFKDAVVANDWKEKGYTNSPYLISKALLNAWTHYVLPKSLIGDQQCFVMSPGHCRTDIGGSKALRSADDGADTIDYLINDIPFKLDKEVHAKFFADRRLASL